MEKSYNQPIEARPLVRIVEDDATLMTMLRYNLERQGFRVEEATDGDEALACIRELRPDLVLLDWMLPIVSGLEVCRQIRRNLATRDLALIMLSARTSDRDIVLGLNAGADDYITKPFNLAILLARMRSLLRRARALPERPTLGFVDLTVDLAAYRVSQWPRRSPGTDRVPSASIPHAASKAGLQPCRDP
jgi:two-component system, OmpR family, phosphate regulon response regulator PhoB